MVNPNSTHSSHLSKALSELKSLLQETIAVFACFIVMLVLTGGKPPSWMIPVTFLLTSVFVFWAEKKREKSSSQLVIKQPDRLATSSKSSQQVPIHFLQQGQSKTWNAWIANRDPNLPSVNLFRANLSDANLSNFNLSGAIFFCADLSKATLIEADLSYASLIRANLNYANLSGADLSYANLRGADLSGANLSGTNVEGAQFGKGIGLSESQKFNLKERRAIFDDSTGERESVLRK
jgi:Pentapeptide repeats (8 copies)